MADKGIIIDWEKKGNVVRFYVGDPEVKDYYGDDWDDRPYEHNAGRAYDEFIIGVADVPFDFEYSVQEPADDWHYNGNSPYCKDDFKARRAPIIVAYKPAPNESFWSEYDYTEIVGNDAAEKIYMGDEIEIQKPYDPRY